MENIYMPDGYVFLLINNEIVKVFCSWSGGYLNGDAYRINSGTESIVEKKDCYLVYGYSGSLYRLSKSSGHINSYCQGVLNEILKEGVVQQITPEQAIEFLKESQ